MSQNINAEIIAIGTEILLGEITDTNSVYLAQTLRDYGINLYYMTSVGDNERRIADAIGIALSRADIVITCGGLGPTVDDMTRQAVARATERELVFHQELLDQIAARFNNFRVRMTENNRRQAYLPAGALVVENAVGTAPAFIVELGDKVIISLPGVPREMKYLMTEKVIPYLRQRHQLGVIKAKVLRTAGIGESMLDDLIGADLLENANPTVGLAAHSGQVDVRITAKAETPAQAADLIAQTEAVLMSRIGQFVFGTDNDRLEQVLINSLQAVNGTLAIAEAGTGGGVGALLQKIDPPTVVRSEAFSHPDELATRYDLHPETPLRDVALFAAERLKAETGAHLAIVISSLPDVDENADNAESTVVVVMADHNTRSRFFGFGGQADFASRWISMWAMSAAWGLLREQVSDE